MATQEQLKKCFINALGSSARNGIEQLSFGSTAWDSVAHIALITELESTFNVELAPEEITELDSYVKAKEILSRHGIDLSN
jgi:acyl carrier protein